MDKLRLIIKVVINFSVHLVTKIIPKKDNLWVFGAWFGTRYSDNPKAFFEYINSEQQHIHAVWICKESTVIEQVNTLGFKAFHEKSLLGIWYQLRAEFVFICQSLHADIYAPCIGKRTTVVNLWHGLPLKKIMYDVFGDKATKKNLTGKLFDKLSSYNNIRNDYLLATSEETQKILSKAFRVPKERTIITGFPRNDVFLKPLTKAKNSIYKCIYMPTFRGGIGSECDLFTQYGFNVKAIDEALLKHNIALVLRMHPVNKPPQYLMEEIEDTKSISIDHSADVYETIVNYDCLITDYSSIYFDFLLTDKPIVFTPFDLVRYKQNERALYFDFSEVTFKPYCLNWPEVITRLIGIKEQGVSADYNTKYQVLKLKFHEKPDENFTSFSKKLFEQLIKV